MPGNGGSYKQGGLELDSAKLSMPNQCTSMLDWFAVDLEGEHSAMDGQILKKQQRNHGWKEANGFCLLVFDPGGMIFLLTCLLLHTIHNLDAEGAVFDPGKRVVMGLINTDSSWSEAGKREVMEVWFCASPVAVQAQG